MSFNENTRVKIPAILHLCRLGYSCKKFGYYRMLLKRFPYAIYYDTSGHIAYVVTVLSMRRDPLWLDEQITERSN